jgi:hypothetical protein
MKRLALSLVLALGFSAAATAQEIQPFPAPRITLEQWVGYPAQIQSKPGTTRKLFPEQQLIIFTDHATHTQ